MNPEEWKALFPEEWETLLKKHKSTLTITPKETYKMTPKEKPTTPEATPVPVKKKTVTKKAAAKKAAKKKTAPKRKAERKKINYEEVFERAAKSAIQNRLQGAKSCKGTELQQFANTGIATNGVRSRGKKLVLTSHIIKAKDFSGEKDVTFVAGAALDAGSLRFGPFPDGPAATKWKTMFQNLAERGFEAKGSENLFELWRNLALETKSDHLAESVYRMFQPTLRRAFRYRAEDTSRRFFEEAARIIAKKKEDGEEGTIADFKNWLPDNSSKNPNVFFSGHYESYPEDIPLAIDKVAITPIIATIIVSPEIRGILKFKGGRIMFPSGEIQNICIATSRSNDLDLKNGDIYNMTEGDLFPLISGTKPEKVEEFKSAILIH